MGPLNELGLLADGSTKAVRYFSYLTVDTFLRKIRAGEIAIPLIRIDAGHVPSMCRGRAGTGLEVLEIRGIPWHTAGTRHGEPISMNRE